VTGLCSCLVDTGLALSQSPFGHFLARLLRCLVTQKELEVLLIGFVLAVEVK